MLAPFTTNYVGLVHDICDGCNIGSSMSNFKIVPTTILYKGMTNYDNETCMMNIDSNVDDIKDYVGTSIYILKSQNPPISSRHVFNLTMSNFNAYMHILKKFQRWPHSLLTIGGRCMTFVMGVLEFHVKFQDSFDNDSIEGNDEH
jgi:hypothetical protein